MTVAKTNFFNFICFFLFFDLFSNCGLVVIGNRFINEISVKKAAN